MEDGDVNAALAQAKAARRQRRIARGFARVFGTEDGKAVLGYLKECTAWDEAGPLDASTESLQFWTGQRSVVKLVMEQVKQGQRLLANPNEKDDEDE